MEDLSQTGRENNPCSSGEFSSLELSQKRKTESKLVVLERSTSQGKGGILTELCALSWLQI